MADITTKKGGNLHFEINTNKYVVSVIVATYRRNIELKNALISLIKQTYKYIEIIVVDDNADKDWNEKVLDVISFINGTYKQNIIYIRNELNEGSAETRNIGIRASTGDYVTFLDDDDLFLPQKVENQINHMLESDAAFSITDLYLYNENDKLIEKRTRKYIKRYSKDFLFRYHFMYHLTGTDTLMFKRDYLLQIGGFPKINVGDEFYLVQKAIEAEGKFSYFPKCDVKAYVHTKTKGLSSGDRKIQGENNLYLYKKRYFHKLPKKSRRYITMRHYAVLAFTELRRKRYGHCTFYTIKSFMTSPIGSMLLFIRRK